MNTKSIDALNESFGDGKHLQIEPGKGSIPQVRLKNSFGEVIVSTHGAHVLSYVPTGQEEVIFVSEDAVFAEGKSIRGGIPVCTPWFAEHAKIQDLPFHGFGRTRSWSVVAAGAGSHDTPDSEGHFVRFQFSPSKEVMKVFPFPFRSYLDVHLAANLSVTLTVENLGDSVLELTGALHSYFRVDSLNDLRLEGLDGVSYLDKVQDYAPEVQSGDVVFRGEVDRIYENTLSDCLIRDPSGQRTIHVGKTGSKSTVVWNPGAERATAMNDLPNDAYNEFICVETTNAGSDVISLKPNRSHAITQKISVSEG